MANSLEQLPFLSGHRHVHQPPQENLSCEQAQLAAEQVKAQQAFSYNEFEDVNPLPQGAQGEATVVRLISTQNLYVRKRLPYGTNEQKKDADQEVNMLMRASSENIVKFIGKFEHQQGLFIITEYCEGGNFREKINSERNSPLGFKYLFEMLLALQLIHRLKMVHRDVKPENIFIDKDEKAKTGDFGLAQVIESKSYLKSAGTKVYAPAEAHRFNKMTYESDIWALGVVMIEFITGQHPFEESKETTHS
ncbi:MAG: putative serine/threonine-protein kinase Nek1 [Streblomastix strix]|uniref:non-specific serine/threonine protein kinase n=1 Tax=Streblomastix strix TaxID=222440 RepID=A0A5J4WCQ5_9EUKA|nr:MAG: putative serine/threonine-protein kinase Nek1 [Streblomastix strix]